MGKHTENVSYFSFANLSIFTYFYSLIATVAMTQDQLTKTIPSDMDGNPPLYITKNRNGDIYVNNARIIPSLSVEMTNNENKRQVCTIRTLFNK